jgi:chitinase
LRELRAAFAPKGWLLTSAVSAGKATIDLAYDIPEMSRLCDFINLMGYDMHGAWNDYTGHNAPLFGRPGEPESERMLNIDYAVNYWIIGGASPSKLALGMPVYGKQFIHLEFEKQYYFHDSNRLPYRTNLHFSRPE